MPAVCVYGEREDGRAVRGPKVLGRKSTMLLPDVIVVDQHEVRPSHRVNEPPARILTATAKALTSARLKNRHTFRVITHVRTQ